MELQKDDAIVIKHNESGYFWEAIQEMLRGIGINCELMRVEPTVHFIGTITGRIVVKPPWEQ